MIYKLLKLIMLGDVHTEDNLRLALGVTEEELEELFDELEVKGFLKVDNEYFDKTCDNCQKHGNCSTDPYQPNERVKKIRVLTQKAVSYAREHFDEL